MKGVRFAPSPTGRFHIGNLRTAWVSREIASRLGEHWVVRFEDIDRPRIKYDAKALQLKDLETLGLLPDRVYDQSSHHQHHFEMFVKGFESGAIYPCFCTRLEIKRALKEMASAPHRKEAGYTGECRKYLDRKLLFERFQALSRKNELESLAYRFVMPQANDDFIVARTKKSLEFSARDFTPSYHFACALDDLKGDYRILVRASDLKPAERLQNEVQAFFASLDPLKKNFIPARVFHTSLVVSDDGQRLEKRTEGTTLEDLLEQGFTPEAILKLFQKSFHYDLSLGSEKETLTMGELFRGGR